MKTTKTSHPNKVLLPSKVPVQFLHFNFKPFFFHKVASQVQQRVQTANRTSIVPAISIEEEEYNTTKKVVTEKKVVLVEEYESYSDWDEDSVSKDITMVPVNTSSVTASQSLDVSQLK